jgi:hypothetical protein
VTARRNAHAHAAWSRRATTLVNHEDGASTKIYDTSRTHMNCEFSAMRAIAPARLRLRAQQIACALAATSRACRKQAYLSVENFSQHTAFLPCAVTHTTKIERIDAKVIRVRHRSATKVAADRDQFSA